MAQAPIWPGIVFPSLAAWLVGRANMPLTDGHESRWDRTRTMLRIRDEQLQSVRKLMTADVEDELFEDVKRYFEDRHTYIGDAQTRVAVRHGIERAEFYGFTSLRGFALYVTLAFVLGSHFDKNPLYPWVKKNLFDDRSLVETTRTHRFYNALRRYLRAARDETGVYNEPILRYPETPLEPSPHGSGELREQHLVGQLETIAQAQFIEAQSSRVTELLRLAIERGAARGITTSVGVSVYVPLTFLLGVGFDEDPQFPWATDALTPRNGDGDNSAALRLHEAALAFRQHALMLLNKPAPSRG